MVMETRTEESNNPSPRSVGREFVRQYYTILHEGPQYLHRFYSQNSSFIHGGVEKPGFEQQPVIGQTDIHKKVMSLDFQDCHAKIRQVDSQATVGNGVVVQVTGELSKNGMQMRRFMQTFVLAPQSQKNYYVYNDIFRYQDEVFSDTESEKEDEPLEAENDVVDMPSQQVEEASEMSYEAPPNLSNGTHHYNNSVEDIAPSNALDDEDHEKKDEIVEDDIADMEEKDVQEDIGEEKGEAVEEYKKPEEDIQREPTGTFSWAALAGKTNSGSISSKPVPKPMEKGDSSNGGHAQPQRVARPPRERMGAVRDRGAHSGSTGRNESEVDDFNMRKPTVRYPDSRQLFVGNLPHDVKEADLKEFFEEFGEVVDVRINTKGAGGKIPNYAFVAFDSEESVQKVIEARPLKRFRRDQLLNVELKKRMGDNRPGGPRPSFPSGNRGPPMDRNNYSRGGGMGRGMRMSGPSQNDRGFNRDMRGGMSGGPRGGGVGLRR